MAEITQLLKQAAQGERVAMDELMPVIYERLRSIAHRQILQEPPGRTLETTALVHEAYIALFGDTDLEWRDRGHFFSYAARAMRSILVDSARERLANKRRSNSTPLDIGENPVSIDDECVDLLALDEVLTKLIEQHPRLVRVVELRFFAGLSVEQTASALQVDSRTVERDWQKARAFINRACAKLV